jgi:transposase InsO family protein
VGLFTQNKTDVLMYLSSLELWLKRALDRSIKCLRIDNGGEFMSKEFEYYCKEVGIERHKTIIYTPQQNGVVERMNKTLLERARSMLNNAKLQQELWEEVVNTTCYLVNWSLSVAIDSKISGRGMDRSSL